MADPAEVQVRLVTPAEVAWFDQQLADHHYLGAGQPVGLAASGELIDDDAAVFLPGAGFGHGRAVGGVWLLGEQAVAKDEAAADKGVEVG